MPHGMLNNQYEIIWLIRRLFRTLSKEENKNLEHTGVSLSERAVMEFLYTSGQLSVPQMAHKYRVSRQHIQVSINSLSQKNLIESEENPAHKRSKLFFLNKRGAELYERILGDDEKAVKGLFRLITKDEISITKDTLQKILDTLQQEP